MVRDDIEDMLIAYQTGDNSEHDVLVDIKQAIDRIVPYGNLQDIDYMKYNSCCGCDAFSPPDNGYKIKDIDGMKIPLCDKCYKEDNINWELVAKLYYRLSLSLDRTVEYYMD